MSSKLNNVLLKSVSETIPKIPFKVLDWSSRNDLVVGFLIALTSGVQRQARLLNFVTLKIIALLLLYIV